MRKNRKYTAEEKLKYVKMYLEEGVSKKQIAREEDIRLDRVLMEELEQQVWKGLIQDIKKFKI